MSADCLLFDTAGSKTVAALPIGPGRSDVALMAANRLIDSPEAQLLLRSALPAALLPDS